MTFKRGSSYMDNSKLPAKVSFWHFGAISLAPRIYFLMSIFLCLKNSISKTCPRRKLRRGLFYLPITFYIPVCLPCHSNAARKRDKPSSNHPPIPLAFHEKP